MSFNPITYVRESKAELAKVIWPTPKETVRLTLVVLFISVAVGLYLTGLDTILAKAAELIIK